MASILPFIFQMLQATKYDEELIIKEIKQEDNSTEPSFTYIIDAYSITRGQTFLVSLT